MWNQTALLARLEFYCDRVFHTLATVCPTTIAGMSLLTASVAAASGLEPGVPYEMMRSCYRDEEPAGGGVMRVRSGLKRSGTVRHATRW